MDVGSPEAILLSPLYLDAKRVRSCESSVCFKGKRRWRLAFACPFASENRRRKK
jgi:hypothetical protein